MSSRRSSTSRAARAAAVLTVAAAGLLPGAAPSAAEPAKGVRILVFTKTTGFRHTSIPVALAAVRELGARNGFSVDATESGGAFTDANLARYDAVVFLLTTGDVLDAGQQQAFQRYIRRGGGYAGVHSASDTEHGWAWYGRLVGAFFRTHPAIQRGVIDVARVRNPSTAGLPRRWARTDEWYAFTRNPRSAVRVLATLDESTYSPGDATMGADHPIAWSHEFEGGRAWYTAGGHTEQSYAEPLFRRHLLGGIRYAAGLSPPRITSVTATVHNRRLHVNVRYSSCSPCAGRLRVRAGRRLASSQMRLRAGLGTATSPPLPRGRSPYTVAVEDPLTGLHQTVSRSVRVP
jgi:type 1 glutamine amidotransferase